MSMNLYLRVDGKEVDLYQTPTHVTRMCLADGESFGYKWDVKGKRAKQAVTAYCHWVQSCSYGKYNSGEEAVDARKLVDQHIKGIIEEVKKGKKIEVYQM